MQKVSSTFDATSAWARRIRRAVLALLAAMVFAVATPLSMEPPLRAGVLRRVHAVMTYVAVKPKPTARLDVPFFRQERALSCEAAALRMALAYRGVDVAERELLAQIGVDPAPHTRTTWGDPDEAFVGNVDGSMGKTGYGVHAGPIARVAGTHRKVEVIMSGTPALLADEVSRGNPVIIWGFVPGRGKVLTWETLGGKDVRAIDGEHTRVVVGYTGTVDAPTGFHVIDPVFGAQYWKTPSFLRNWEALGKMAVVVQ